MDGDTRTTRDEIFRLQAIPRLRSARSAQPTTRRTSRGVRSKRGASSANATTAFDHASVRESRRHLLRREAARSHAQPMRPVRAVHQSPRRHEVCARQSAAASLRRSTLRRSSIAAMSTSHARCRVAGLARAVSPPPRRDGRRLLARPASGGCRGRRDRPAPRRSSHSRFARREPQARRRPETRPST